MKTTAALALSLLLPLVTTLPGCGGHPLAGGGWTEEVSSGVARELSFAEDGRLLVHAHGRPDGGPEHMDGTWTLEGDRLTLRWTDGGKQVEMKGTLHGDHIEVEAGGAKVEFHRGESSHH